MQFFTVKACMTCRSVSKCGYMIGYIPVKIHTPRLLGISQFSISLFQVRQICKPLKNAMNIHSVSVHSETPMQHQVDGWVTLPEDQMLPAYWLRDAFKSYLLNLFAESFVACALC
jgi:hypothetical protein